MAYRWNFRYPTDPPGMVCDATFHNGTLNIVPRTTTPSEGVSLIHVRVADVESARVFMRRLGVSIEILQASERESD